MRMLGTDQRVAAKKLFARFFINYLWVGIFFVMAAISLDLEYPQKSYPISVAIRALETIGLAVLIAAIFDFAIGTSEFINKIQALLQGIIVNRNFLGNIDVESKRHALAALIKPTDIERRIYANLEDYYDTYIRKTLDISNKCVRSDYRVHAYIYIDKEKNKIVIEDDVSYRIHPTKDGYDSIRIGFEASESDSRIDYVAINTPDGKRELHTEFDWKPMGEGSGTGKVAEIPLNGIGDGHSHLNIEMKLHEYGKDHWVLVGWHALQPTDGFHYHIRCAPGIKTKTALAFVHGAKIYTESRSPQEYRFICNQWFNEGTGIVAVAGIDDGVSEGICAAETTKQEPPPHQSPSPST